MTWRFLRLYRGVRSERRQVFSRGFQTAIAEAGDVNGATRSLQLHSRLAHFCPLVAQILLDVASPLQGGFSGAPPP